MNKSDRLKVFNKYGGRCAYCGCELPVKGWHLDHMEPIGRRWKYKTLPNGLATYTRVPNGCDFPERDHIDNAMPSCAKCNINKHGDTVEQFRANIAKYLESLNKRMVQYQMAKKYGLVKETGNYVVFYFERHGANH
jgi:hypothetical protein